VSGTRKMLFANIRTVPNELSDSRLIRQRSSAAVSLPNTSWLDIARSL